MLVCLKPQKRTHAHPVFVVLSVPGFLQITQHPYCREVLKIGAGGGGSITVVELTDADLLARSGTLMAIAKTMLDNSCQSSRLAFNQEISVMNYLNSKYPSSFPKLLGFDSSTLTVIMPYYQIGSLSKYLKTEKASRTRQRFQFVKDIAVAIQCMHREGMAHCDLKPDNVLVTFDNHTKQFHCILTDFGLSKILNEESLKVKSFNVVNMRGLSFLYAAPEVLAQFRKPTSASHPNYFKFSDIYSYACIVYECLCLKRPW